MTRQSPVRVVHTVGSIAEETGGPARTVTHLCSALAVQGCGVQLVAGKDSASESAWVKPAPAVSVFDVPAERWLRRIRYYPDFAETVTTRLREGGATLVHDHGIWAPTNVSAFRAARAAKVPYVLSPRGMLEPWALRYKAGKKRLAWLAYQRRIVAGAAALVATAAEEREHIKALFPKVPVAVIPNGVAWPAELPQRTTNETRRALFLSRVHPKKNVLGLIRAWHSTCSLPGRGGWTLEIAGPDELGHTTEAKALVASLGLADRVVFSGPVGEAHKDRAFAQADLFVLPSFSENFGVAVAEALSFGVPAIATTGTPWRSLQEQGCGWWVNPTDDGLAAALAAATALNDDERHAMGLRGRAHTRAAFAWPGIAQMTLQLYEWLLGQRSEPPPFVDV